MQSSLIPHVKETLPDLKTFADQVKSYNEHLCVGKNLSSFASLPGVLLWLPTVSPAEYVQTPLVCVNTR